MTFFRRNLLIFGLTAVASTFSAHAQYFSQREDVRAFIKDLSTRDGFSTDELEAAFAAADPVPKVIDLIKPPTQPGIRSWKRYRARFIDSIRISAGIQFWRTYEAKLNKAEEKYGVPAEIIAAVIGVETIYGRNKGNFSTLSALATLAFDYPPRSALFMQELEALFLLAREQGKNVLDYRGSYAGALGYPQFLPSSVRLFAEDGDGDGVIDLQNSPEDAIMSVARYLAIHGWQRGGRIVEPARIAPDADVQALVDVGIEPRLTADDLKKAQIQVKNYPTDGEPVTLVDLITPGEPTQYWLGFQNFYVITRYNHSSFYAMSVNDLAQALKLEHGMSSMRNEMQTLASAAPSHASPKKRIKKKK